MTDDEEPLVVGEAYEVSSQSIEPIDQYAEGLISGPLEHDEHRAAEDSLATIPHHADMELPDVPLAARRSAATQRVRDEQPMPEIVSAGLNRVEPSGTARPLDAPIASARAQAVLASKQEASNGAPVLVLPADKTDLPPPTTAEHDRPEALRVRSVTIASAAEGAAEPVEPAAEADRELGAALGAPSASNPEARSEPRVGVESAAAIDRLEWSPAEEPADALPATAPGGVPAEAAAESGDLANVTTSRSAAPREHRRRFHYHEILGGKYRLEKSLARGGMGLVFLATQLPLGREVAVKVLIPRPGDNAFRRRFLLEASTCAKLSHPNIVTIHDYGQTPRGDVFMAMEYLRGQSLSRTLTREKRLSADRASRIILQVARALRVAHRAGVVHRDLKPSNVMLLPDTDDGSTYDFVKVVDFGLAKLYEAPEFAENARLTRAGMMLGSPRYMAPEQIRNQDVDPRTDIYSLGVIFFAMLTGRLPFDGDNSTEILSQHLRDPAPSMNSVAGDLEISMELESIVARCLAKHPNGRYQTIDDFLADLKVAMRQMTDNSSGDFLPADFLSASASIRPPASTRSGFAPQFAHSGGVPPDPGTIVGTQVEPGFETIRGTVPVDKASQIWWAVALVLLSVICALLFWAQILE